MQLLRTTLVLIALVCLGQPARAQATFIGLRYICDVNASGPFQWVSSSTGSYPVAYHQVLNYHPFVQATFCRSGRVGLPPDGCPGEFASVAAVTLWSLDIVCRGGVMSAAQVTVHKPVNPVRLGDYALAGNSLVFTTRTQPITRYIIPAGYGALEPRDINNPLEAIDARILNPQIQIQGTPPGQPTPVRNILFDTAPIPQIALALLVALYAGFVFIGSFHNKKSAFHPSRPLFPILILASLAGLYASAYDPAPDARDTYQRAQQMMQSINADRAKLATVLTVRNGLIEPFTQQQYFAALSLMSTHVIPDTTNFQSSTNIRVGISLVPFVVFLLCFVPYAYAGYYYLFRKPPSIGVITPALDAGTPMPVREAHASLMASVQPPPNEAADDSDMRHLSQLAATIAAATRRHAAAAASAVPTVSPPFLPDMESMPGARPVRRNRILGYLFQLLENRERTLALELDSARQARLAKS